MSTTKRKIILQKLSALNTVWHPESGLVFKSQKERLVIGSYVNDNLVDLDEDSLALCEEWNFKPDESLLANEEDEQPTDEEPEEESNEQPTDEEPEEEECKKQATVVEPQKSISKSCSEDQKTIELIKQLSNNFVTELVPIVEKLQKVVAEKTSEVNSLTETLALKTKEYEDLEEKYNSMDQKFKTMKSLFT